MGTPNYWESNSSQSWGTAGNWSLGLVPTNAHNVIITKERGTAPIDGATVTAPESVHVAGDVDYDLGSSGSPIIFNTTGVTMEELVYHGVGKGYFSWSAAGTISRVNAEILSQLADRLNLKTESGGPEIGKVVVKAGRVTIQTGADLATLFVGRLGSLRGEANIIVESAATIDNLKQLGGRVQSSSAITGTIHISAGMLQQLVGNLGSVAMWGGIVDFRTDGGVVTLIDAYRGLFDMSKDGTPKTVTNMNIWEGFVDTRSGAGGGSNITLTNNPAQFSAKGDLLQSGSRFTVDRFA